MLRRKTSVTIHAGFTFTGTSLPFPEMRTHFGKDVTKFGTKITKLKMKNFEGDGDGDIRPPETFGYQSWEGFPSPNLSQR